MSSVDQLLQSALQHHQTGQLQQAEGLYRQVLKIDPNQSDALRLLGVLAIAVGHPGPGVELLGKAIAVNPRWPEALYDLAIGLKALGRLPETIDAYRNVLSLNPWHLESHFNLAIALRETGDLGGAIAEYKHVIDLNPKLSEAHLQIGILFAETNQLDPAIAAFKSVLGIEPGHVQALLHLGAALHRRQEIQESIAVFRKVVALEPGNAHAHSNLGALLRENGKAEDLDEAIAECRQAIVLLPEHAEAHVNLGSALKEAHRFTEAEAEYQTAIVLKPDCAEAYSNLGAMLQERNQNDRATDLLRKAIAKNPNLAAGHGSLGNALRDSKQFDDALAEYRLAISLDANVPEYWHGIGNVLKELCCVEEGIAAIRRSLDILPPGKPTFHSNLVMSLNYYPPYAPQAIAEEHFQWDQRHAQPLASRIKPLPIDRSPNRRLRIGYLSPDFREHVVSLFVMPILANHNHTDFEIFCYANVAYPDAITAKYQELADHWRNIEDIPDEQAAEMIRQDRIDILIDLAGHSGDHRLLILARKPAPIQVTYIGYPATTGMKAIDYRITDAVADPPGMTESLHSETLARLPRCNWCYQPPARIAAAVSDPPNPNSHPIVFACFTNPAKVNQQTVDLWGQILQKMPGSTFVLKAGSLGNDSVRQRFSEMMSRAGIAPDRFQLVRTMKLDEHLPHFSKIDIFLDTFPYNGTTTTCETLWMGVPVVTLAGKSHVSRVSASLLTAVGLPELIAQTPDEYVKIAVDLANDLPRLTHIRSTLRQKMQESQLCDGPGMARAMEQLYRGMWHRWCDEIRMTKLQ